MYEPITISTRQTCCLTGCDLGMEINPLYLRLILFKFSDKEAVLTLDAPLLYFLVELLHYSAPARTPGSTLRSFCLADSDAVVGKTDLHNALGLQ